MYMGFDVLEDVCLRYGVFCRFEGERVSGAGALSKLGGEPTAVRQPKVVRRRKNFQRFTSERGRVQSALGGRLGFGER